MTEILERIARALEQIAGLALDAEQTRTKLEQTRTKRREAGQKSAEIRLQKLGTAQPGGGVSNKTRTNAEQNSTHFVIKSYCEAYKEKYGINPIIDGKTTGLVKALTKTVPGERLRDLVQAYLQMDNPWFKTKCHDFVTFTQSLSQVAVALANGTEDPHERDYWRKVFGDGEENIRNATQTNERDVGGEALPSGTRGNSLASLPERLR